MPKSRRVSKKNKSLWAKIAGLFVVLFIAFWLLLPQQSNSVLGVSTTNFFGLGSKSANTNSNSNTSSTCKPMLSAITLSNPCMGKNNQPGFKSISYTCANGTKGSSTKDCLSPQQALDNAGKTCSKGSSCKPPSNNSQHQGQQGGMQQQGGQGQAPQDNSSSQ